MSSEIHLLFFPFMAPGHMIPMVDMATLFASRGVKSTIVTTPSNAAFVQPTLDRAKAAGHRTQLVLIRFPSSDTDVAAEGPHNLLHLPTHEEHMRFMVSLAALRDPFELLLREHAPDAIVTDVFLPWTVDVAVGLGVPRLMFQGSGFFSMCAVHSLKQCRPRNGVFEDSDSYVLPGLPHRIEISRTQIFDRTKLTVEFIELMNKVEESAKTTYGVVTNSFYELEPEYVEYYKEFIAKKSWHIGPLSLCNTDESDLSVRGGNTSVDHKKCMNWLDSKKPRSVVYICFGSLCNFKTTQLREIASGLVSSSHPFIWVVGKNNDELWLPEEFDVEKCLIIRGWAPQVMILKHQAVGAFMMHCGWNSCLEGVAAGVPMVAWPLFAEQFYNEKLMVQVLKVGVTIGDVRHSFGEEERMVVTGEEIGKAIAAVMGGGDDVVQMRKRLTKLREMAERAVEIGGSSYNDLDRLIRELRCLTLSKTL